MAHVAESIRKLIALNGEGAPVMAKQFLHLASRAAVDQALSRLCRAGELQRAGRGVYVRQVTSRFGVRAPSPERVVEALAALRGETIAPSGASMANVLGLTTQVPVRTVYLTSGPTRRLKLGAQEIELQHARPWELLWPKQLEGHVIRVLSVLGTGEIAHKIGVLRQRLSPRERQKVAAASVRVPSWMAARMTALGHD